MPSLAETSHAKQQSPDFTVEFGLVHLPNSQHQFSASKFGHVDQGLICDQVFLQPRLTGKNTYCKRKRNRSPAFFRQSAIANNPRLFAQVSDD